MRAVIVLLLAVLAASTAAVQRPTSSKPAIDTPHVTITTSVGTEKMEPGGKVTLVVDIAPKPKMHVYAPEEKDGIPVTVTIAPHPALTPGAAEFPPPEKFFFAPLKLTQLVYSKPFRIRSPIAIKSGSSKDTLTVNGTLRYQACDDAVCYLPKTVPLNWELKSVVR
jgi:DsbC/DsbD-like thiol-disulfide interchange protein